MKVDLHRIENLITPIIETMGYIVWHVELHRVQRKILLRIYVDISQGDKRKSISVDDCSRISNQVGALIDVEEPMLGNYILEVSSPGLERSLFKLEHYKQYIGSTVRIVLRQPMDKQRDLFGKIQGVFDNTVKLDINGSAVDIDIINISRAKLILDLQGE